jgi:hypothetical protein
LLSSSIVPGVLNGGGFFSGVQGDTVPGGPLNGFTADGFGSPSGGLGRSHVRADALPAGVLLWGRADAAGVLVSARPANTDTKAAIPASTADRRRIVIQTLLMTRFILLSTDERYQASCFGGLVATRA